jgi:protein-ribulosamine 3-kinase
MNIKSEIANKIEECLGEPLVSSKSVGGGCIADSRTVETKSGQSYFLKTLSGAPGMFLMEANGLKELAKANAIRIPTVILADHDFLLLENIQPGGKSKSFFEDFGAAFATMHRYTQKEFGFYEDNYIGATPQLNCAEGKQKTSWAEFYYQKRILQQLRFAEKNGYATKELVKGINLLEHKIESVIKGSRESPALLHGDLWGGNYMSDEQGNAVLIDPAVYYGHREADLAMTKMFGGFTAAFYQAYQETYPLPDGWEYRQGLYLLYHYLNHLNLFGRGYYGECIHLLYKYV